MKQGRALAARARASPAHYPRPIAILAPSAPAALPNTRRVPSSLNESNGFAPIPLGTPIGGLPGQKPMAFNSMTLQVNPLPPSTPPPNAHPRSLASCGHERKGAGMGISKLALLQPPPRMACTQAAAQAEHAPRGAVQYLA